MTVVLVEQGVEKRVQRGVSISEPHEGLQDQGADAVALQRTGHVQAKERKPAEQEDPNDQTQCLHCLLFLLQGMAFNMSLDSSAGVSPHRTLVHLLIDCVDPPRLSPGGHEDFPIGKQHETHGNEEGDS